MMTVEGSTEKRAERLSDRAFSRGLWASVISLLICLALLCSVTYAWFTSEVESGTNNLVSGSFSLSMKVTDSHGNEIPLVADDGTRPSARTATLTESGIYTVTLTLDEKSNAKGYCIVNCNRKYPKLTDVIVGEHTLNAGEHEKNTPLVFQVEVVVGIEPIPLTLEPCYGPTAAPHIFMGTIIHQNDFTVQH